MAVKRTSASVIWELSDEGKVVVDVDVPLRPFGGLHQPRTGADGRSLTPGLTPAQGILLPRDEQTEPDGAAVVDAGVVPKR